MSNIGHWHYTGCADCGVAVLNRANGGWEVLCKECKIKRRVEREKRKHLRRYIPVGDPDSYVVVEDPDKECGYRPGAIISRMQVSFMLLESYEGFTPGTILTNRAGELFRVIKEKRKFKLVIV